MMKIATSLCVIITGFFLLLLLATASTSYIIIEPCGNGAVKDRPDAPEAKKRKKISYFLWIVIN